LIDSIGGRAARFPHFFHHLKNWICTHLSSPSESYSFFFFLGPVVYESQERLMGEKIERTRNKKFIFFSCLCFFFFLLLVGFCFDAANNGACASIRGIQ
jgi:hypothetical protein